MIANYLGKVKKNHRRSSFVSPALGWAGQGRLFRSPLAKNFWRSRARAGREGKGGWGKGISAPPERKFSEIGVGIFSVKSPNFFQQTPH